MGGKFLPLDYFSEGVFVNALPGELLARYSCVECGLRFKTFASFKAHRRECPGRQVPLLPSAAHQPGRAA